MFDIFVYESHVLEERDWQTEKDVGNVVETTRARLQDFLRQLGPVNDSGCEFQRYHCVLFECQE